MRDLVSGVILPWSCGMDKINVKASLPKNHKKRKGGNWKIFFTWNSF